MTASPTPSARHRRAPSPVAPQRLLPLGALAAGFGLLQRRRARPDRAGGRRGARLGGVGRRAPRRQGRHGAAPIAVKAKAETDQNSVRATTSDDRPRQPGAARRPAVGDRRHREADGGPPRRHREGGAALHRRHHLPGGRGRRGRHPPARLLADRERRHLRRRHPRPGVLRPRHLQLRPDRGAARLGVDAVRPRLDRRRRQPGQQGSRCSTNANEVYVTVGTGSYIRADRRLQRQDRRRRRRCAST